MQSIVLRTSQFRGYSNTCLDFIVRPFRTFKMDWLLEFKHSDTRAEIAWASNWNIEGVYLIDIDFWNLGPHVLADLELSMCRYRLVTACSKTGPFRRDLFGMISLKSIGLPYPYDAIVRHLDRRIDYEILKYFSMTIQIFQFQFVDIR